MMNELFRIILTGTIAGSGLFAMALLLEYFFQVDYIEQILLAMKGVLFFYLISVLPVTFVVASLTRQVKIQLVHSGDFSYIKWFEGMKNMETAGAVKDVAALLGLVWLVVFIVLIFRFVIKNVCFSRKLSAASVVIEDERLALLKKYEGDWNIMRNTGLYECSLISSPVLIGIVQPKIMLPRGGEYDFWEWEMFIKHEMCHLKKHDLFYRLLLELLICVHWFNPIVVFFVFKFYEISELVCDSNTVEGYSLEERGCYAKLLNKAMERKPSVKTLASFSGSYQRAERRIRNIMKRKKRKNNLAFSLAAGILLILCPMVSYASAEAVNYAEEFLVNQYRLHHDNKQGAVYAGDGVITDYKDMKQMEPVETMTRISPGNNVIHDFVVKAMGEGYLNPVGLEKGDKVKIGVVSGNSDDNYIGGVVDCQGNRYYVNSTNGVLGYTFIISEPGDYRVFFEGENGGGGSDICLNGTVTVAY